MNRQSLIASWRFGAVSLRGSPDVQRAIISKTNKNRQIATIT